MSEKYRRKDWVDLTPNEINAWALKVAGRSVKEIAEKYGKTEVTIYNWVNKVSEQIGATNVEELKNGLFLLYGDAVEALRHSLTIQKDGQVALRLLTGLSVLTDKKDGDNNIQVIVTQEGKAQVEQNRKLAHDRLRYNASNSTDN